jgi:hypothetical protein
MSFLGKFLGCEAAGSAKVPALPSFRSRDQRASRLTLDRVRSLVEVSEFLVGPRLQSAPS